MALGRWLPGQQTGRQCSDGGLSERSRMAERQDSVRHRTNESEQICDGFNILKHRRCHLLIIESTNSGDCFTAQASALIWNRYHRCVCVNISENYLGFFQFFWFFIRTFPLLGPLKLLFFFNCLIK